MALYKYDQFLGKSDHAAFDVAYSPGEINQNSGIYRCEGCAREIASNENDPFPPQNHHQHSPGSGPIRWRMIVFAQQ